MTRLGLFIFEIVNKMLGEIKKHILPDGVLKNNLNKARKISKFSNLIGNR